jgi:hypothetical protein
VARFVIRVVVSKYLIQNLDWLRAETMADESNQRLNNLFQGMTQAQPDKEYYAITLINTPDRIKRSKDRRHGGFGSWDGI